MRKTFRLALGSFALAGLATFAGRTSAQTAPSTGGGLPINTPPPITMPVPTVPGEAMPRPAIPTTPQVAETNTFLDGGSFSLPSSPGFATANSIIGSAAFDGGSLAAFGGLDAFDGGSLSGTSSLGIGGSGTAGFSFDGGL